MINKFILFTYNVLPTHFRNKIGRSHLLKPVRNFFLRINGNFREVNVLVNRNYLNHEVNFNFIASFKVASKAKKRGIENTILRNSIKLIKINKGDINDVVTLDVGANFGYLSLVWANTISKNGQVFAFEPNLKVYDCFCKSIRSNNLDSKIQAKNLAVGYKNETIQLFLDSTSSNVSNTVMKFKKKTTIEMTSLDSFMEKYHLTKCDLVKIDVDGIELDILMGAKEMINKLKPIFIVETNDDRRIIDFFNDLDYHILDMKLNSLQKANHLPQNIFCIPKN